MNKNDAFQILDAFSAIIGFLPDEIVLSTVKAGLPDIIDNRNIPDEEVIELVALYRRRDVPAIKNFIKRMLDDLVKTTPPGNNFTLKFPSTVWNDAFNTDKNCAHD